MQRDKSSFLYFLLLDPVDKQRDDTE
ncbi:MAG TPA: hypothetical protein LFV92_03600 [Rickettsia endosymbiont of Ceroptres masudai]|nr:hypothetical protein [Rickettsia endosymbiont of Ceroptres masudai]